MGGAMVGQAWQAALARLCAVALPEDESANLPDEVFDAVNDLIEAYGADDIAEIVARAVHAGQATVGQATTLLNVAAWSGTDNGASMKLTLDDWVRRADDTVRLSMALHHEVYLLPTAAEMTAVLTDVAARFPEHRAICQDRIAGRRGD
ncbi:hypothetical protein J5Y04_32660 [Kitasatospora sp. RG8]|uniref:hypothetical protein n=1 Tax=Kitasatospora sp. RG8 TaxID=2820815 RepID=UPI001AE05DDE|nr:hypothetical protein [Kitasatospora sp. RG8]MBP0454251.1 hypothetical protein [Kitasatospora sp. RG8]